MIGAVDWCRDHFTLHLGLMRSWEALDAHLDPRTEMFNCVIMVALHHDVVDLEGIVTS